MFKLCLIFIEAKKLFGPGRGKLGMELRMSLDALQVGSSVRSLSVAESLVVSCLQSMIPIT